jgi:hypothetical protein
MSAMMRQASPSTAFMASTGRVCTVCIAIDSAAVCCGVPSGLTYWPTG